MEVKTQPRPQSAGMFAGYHHQAADVSLVFVMIFCDLHQLPEIQSQYELSYIRCMLELMEKFGAMFYIF